MAAPDSRALSAPRRKGFQHRPAPPTALDAFLAGAEPPAAPATAAPPPYPWQTARPDVQKTFLLRLPEPDLERLRYIAAHTPESMQQFCQRHLAAAIEAAIQALTRERA
jgi:hypothetical protein